MGNIVPKTAIDYFKQERNKHTEPYRPFYDAAIEALEKREPRKFPDVECSHVKGLDVEVIATFRRFTERLKELLNFYYPNQKFVHTHIDNLVKEIYGDRLYKLLCAIDHPTEKGCVEE